MPPLKIQPVNSLDDSQSQRESIRSDSGKPVLKSRLKRLFDRQFQSVLRISSAEKPIAGEQHKDGGLEFEPSSVCLAKMVQNFIEENNEKQPAAKYGRNRCNCFNGSNNDSSDDEVDFFSGFGDPFSSASPLDAGELLKSLIPCVSAAERNVSAAIAVLVEKNKTCKRKDDLRQIVTDGLSAMGYDASICKSHWDKSPSYPAGEYEYIDVIVGEERLLIDVDFRSEFEIARSTSNYRAILQFLPHIFVGKPDRLQQVVSLLSEAAKQSLKKKGMHFPPWRKAEYMRAKWLSRYTRINPSPPPKNDGPEKTENQTVAEAGVDRVSPLVLTESDSECGELDLIFGEENASPEIDVINDRSAPLPVENPDGEVKESPEMVSTWRPPAIIPKGSDRGAQVAVTGLAFLLREKP